MQIDSSDQSQKQGKYGGLRKEHTADYKKQKGCCAICGVPVLFNGGQAGAMLDHCHASGEFRGFLCSACNKGLGLFKDNVDVLKKAIDYLQKHRDKSVFWKNF